MLRFRLRAGLTAFVLAAFIWTANACEAESVPVAVQNPNQGDLLPTLQRRAFDYFWQESNSTTGLVKDRAGNHRADHYTVASIAATGFGLAALPVGVEHGWINREQGERRALTTLRFVGQMSQEHGWFFHFIDGQTGQRAWKSEASSVDTALFIAGALVCGEYFGGEVGRLADELYRRVDFHWMLTDGATKPDEKLLCHGWKPETGFLKSRWDFYSEHLILNLLAIGSPTHPIATNCWEAWHRNMGEYKGFKTFSCGPLFTHQYSQAFIDFRGRRDREGYDYFDSSVQATKANRQFCIDQTTRFKTYGSNSWGLSACDRPGGGYLAYGAPPALKLDHDGTVAPWSTVASVVFTPELVLPAIQFMRDQFGTNLWGRYGFGCAYNLDQDWFSEDVIAIDLGAALLMIENHYTGKIWQWYMRIPSVAGALQKAGFSQVK